MDDFDRTVPARVLSFAQTFWRVSVGAFAASWFAACVLGIATSVSSKVLAQDVVLPVSQLSAGGSDFTQIPFGRATPVRVQIIYDARMFDAGGGPITFSEVAFRVEEGLTAASKTLEFEVRASSMGQPVTFVQSTYAANRGSDETVVFDRKIFVLGMSGSGLDPNAFDVVIPFDRDFTFDPTSGGALVLEIAVFGQPPGVFPIDSAFLCESVEESFGLPGCNRPGSPALFAESVTNPVTWGAGVTLGIGGVAEPSGSVVMLFGEQETGIWEGVSLPAGFDAIGAPGCGLSLGVLASFLLVADAAGNARFSFVLPSDPSLVGEWIRFQGLAIDPVANPLGVVSSAGHRVQICGFEPIARVFGAGVTGDAGLREIGFAPVIRLR